MDFLLNGKQKLSSNEHGSYGVLGWKCQTQNPNQSENTDKIKVNSQCKKKEKKNKI